MTQKSNVNIRGCKKHTLVWEISFDELSDILQEKVLKVSGTSMSDDIEVYLKIDPADEKTKDLKIVLKDMEKK